jgi:hypothetical protein
MQLKRIPELKSRLRTIRQKKLIDCCSVDAGKNDTVVLVVDDKPAFNELQKEENEILDHLKKIDDTVDKPDKLFSKAEKDGIQIRQRTPAGCQVLKTEWRNKFGAHNVDDFGRPLSSVGNPELYN